MIDKLTMTLGALADAEQALANVAKLALPIKVAYRLSKLAGTVLAETKLYHEKQNDLIKSLGDEKPPGSGMWTVKPEHIGAYHKQMDELRSAEVILVNVQQFCGDELEGQTVTAADLLALEPLLYWQPPPPEDTAKT